MKGKNWLRWAARASGLAVEQLSHYDGCQKRNIIGGWSLLIRWVHLKFSSPLDPAASFVPFVGSHPTPDSPISLSTPPLTQNRPDVVAHSNFPLPWSVASSASGVHLGRHLQRCRRQAVVFSVLKSSRINQQTSVVPGCAPANASCRFKATCFVYRAIVFGLNECIAVVYLNPQNTKRWNL